MAYPLFDLGGTGPLVHLAPANGFPPETYTSALEPLLPHHRVVSLPPRAMWSDAGPAPEQPGSWVTLAEDLLEGMRRHELPPVVAVGPSFGGGASLLAAVREPARFRGLALLDPTILPPAMMDELKEQRARGEMAFRPLVHGARKRRGRVSRTGGGVRSWGRRAGGAGKRRDRFPSPGEAFDYWREKPLFSDWSDDAVSTYARAMLRASDDGGGLVLPWAPASGARYQ